MLVVVAPGQGAQSMGMLDGWLTIPGAPSRIELFGEACGLDLRWLGTAAEADLIRATEVAQPLIVALGLIAWFQLFSDDLADAVAGHSVGEVTAAVCAGVIDPSQAMVLVGERGRAMARAAQKVTTGMTAILGGERSEVFQALDSHGLSVCNENGPGQLVVGGSITQLEAFAADPPSSTRLIRLDVAGAFHTHHMGTAVDPIRVAARNLSPCDARLPIISNRDGVIVKDGQEVLDRIVEQTSQTVRWDHCLMTMAELGVTGVLELPPGATLVGTVKRSLKGVETFALRSPERLDAAREFCARHISR